MFLKRVSLLAVFFIALSCANEKTYQIGQIETPNGTVLIWLYNETPNHKKSFIELANNGYWDSLSFNRVVPNFVVQGGCVDTPEGFNDPEYLLKPEFNENLTHKYGEVGAGRDDNIEKLSARCQFYIVHNKEGIARLDGNYTIFGKVIEGMDVIDAITKVARDSTNTPLTPVTLDVNIISMNASELEKLYPEFH